MCVRYIYIYINNERRLFFLRNRLVEEVVPWGHPRPRDFIYEQVSLTIYATIGQITS